MTTEGTRLAKNRCNNEHMGTVSCRLDKETKEKFYAVCKQVGRAPNEVLKNFILDYIVTSGEPWVVNNAGAYSGNAVKEREP